MTRKIEELISHLNQLELVKNPKNKKGATELIKAIHSLEQKKKHIADDDNIEMLIFLMAVLEKYPEEIKKDPHSIKLRLFSKELIDALTTPSLRPKIG